jgi:hypothetical protein
MPNQVYGYSLTITKATYEFSIDGDKLTIKNLTFAVDFTATLRQVENTPMPGGND